MGVLGLVATFSVLLPAPPVTESGLNEALASTGKPLTLKVTSSVKPAAGVEVTR